MVKQIRVLSIILIALAGLIVCHNSLGNKFVWDDTFIVEENPLVKSWSLLPKIFTEDLGNIFTKKFILYRPVQILTYAADYSLWKLNAAGYHITNILLHILTAIAVWQFILRLFDDEALAFMTGLLFVIHPIHSEATAYISGRADILSGLFILWCFILYIRQLSSKSAAGYLLMLSCYLLALLSNEYSLIMPFLLILYHYAFKKPLRRREFLPIVLVAVLYIPVRISVSPLLSPNPAYYHALYDRAAGFFVAITNYIRLLILPLGLHMEYGNRIFGFSDPLSAIGLILSCGLICYAFIRRNSHRLAFFSISWFFLGMMPYSGIYPLNAYMAEHWLYIPSIGFFLIVSAAIGSLYRGRFFFRIAALGIFAGLVLSYSYLTMRQNEYWKEPVAFYKRTLLYAPDSARIYNNLGAEYKRLGRYDEAVESYNKAIALDPGYDTAYVNLGIVYDCLARSADAERAFKKAIKANPLNPAPYVGLGILRKACGRDEEAASLFRKAIAVEPSYANAYVNLGLLRGAEGKNAQAAALFRKALEIDPNCNTAAIIYTYLGNAYSDAGDNKAAAAAYMKAIGLDPRDAYAYNNLGIAMHDMGRRAEAISVFKKALEIDPRLASAYVNLGNAYGASGESDKAIASYRKAIAIDPKRSDARRNLEIELLGRKP